MGLPGNKYGIVDNPLVKSPMVSGQGGGSPTPPATNNFLLLSGEDFLLLDGDNFELLED